MTPRRRSPALLTAVLPVAVFAAPALGAQAPTVLPILPPAIAVSATGEDQVTPDRARLSLGVQTQAPTAAAASQENARLQRAVLDAVRAQGVPADQITTSGYRVSPSYDYSQPNRRPTLTGYQVQNTVTVELRRVDQVSPVLDAVLARGANTVNALQFYSSQAEASRRRALAKAVDRARADAETMATAAGGRLGDLLELSSGVEFAQPRPVLMSAMAGGRAMAAPTPISEGTETITASVSARWRFVPNPR